MIGVHSSHVTRISDASSFDEICIHCGRHNEIGSAGALAEPCPKPSEFVETNTFYDDNRSARQKFRDNFPL